MGKKARKIEGDNLAERRMFAKTIIDSDAFLDMPATAQLLYFHLAMRGDDDGFINNPKSIMRNARCSDDDLKVLAAKKFIIPFESGIVVIKHWRIHNYIAKDRYTETKYKEEKAALSLDENKAYSLENKPVYTECIHDVAELETQVRLGKDSKGKDSVVEDSIDQEKKTITTVLNSYAPSGELREALNSFKEMRNKMKKPLTVRALEMALKELDTLSSWDEMTKIKIVDQSVLNSWQKFYPLKNDCNNGNYGKVRKSMQEEADELAAYIDRQNGGE